MRNAVVSNANQLKGKQSWSGFVSLFVLNLIFLSITCWPVTGHTQASNSLFKVALQVAEPSRHGIVAKSAHINKSLIARGVEQIEIELPTDEFVTAQLLDFERRGRGNFTWRGTANLHSETINVTLTLERGYVVGSIDVDGFTFSIQPVRGKGQLYVIEQLDPASFEEEVGTDFIPVPASYTLKSTGPTSTTLAAPTPEPQSLASGD